MEVVKLSKTNIDLVIKKTIETLKNGGLFIYPTETCYGIGADATNQKAIDKLLKYKKKRNDKPISVVVSDVKMASKYVHINKMAKNIYANFLPGPVTVVSRGRGKFARNVESSTGTQGIRVPKYELVLDIVKEYKKPFTATSANASYKKTPYTVKDIFDNISERQKKLIDLVIDAGKLPKNPPSTVVDTTLENIEILREGSISFSNKKVFISKSEDDTEVFAKNMYQKLLPYLGKKCVVILLQGDLGAGKTFFTRHFGKLLKVKSHISSPTFIINREHEGYVKTKKVKMHHIDTYRLYSEQEFDDLGAKSIFKSPNIVIVEWANKFLKHINKYMGKCVVLSINIIQKGLNERKFEYEIQK